MPVQLQTAYEKDYRTTYKQQREENCDIRKQESNEKRSEGVESIMGWSRNNTLCNYEEFGSPSESRAELEMQRDQSNKGMECLDNMSYVTRTSGDATPNQNHIRACSSFRTSWQEEGGKRWQESLSEVYDPGTRKHDDLEEKVMILQPETAKEEGNCAEEDVATGEGGVHHMKQRRTEKRWRNCTTQTSKK